MTHYIISAVIAVTLVAMVVVSIALMLMAMPEPIDLTPEIPKVTKLGPPTLCSYVHDAPRPLASYDVDGTSVCRRHMAEAIVWARGKRAGR